MSKDFQQLQIQKKSSVYEISATFVKMNSISLNNISVIILAAGNSSRMGKTKFLLKFDNKKNFLEKIVEEYIGFGCRNIILVLNQKGFKLLEKSNIKIDKNITTIINKYPEKERFYSIHIACKALKNTDYAFIQNADNPLINKALLNKLTNNILDFDIIVPAYKKKGGHPILISKKVIFGIIYV